MAGCGRISKSIHFMLMAVSYTHLDVYKRQKFDNANLLKLLKDKEAATDFEGNYSQNELLALISSVREGDAQDKRSPSYLYEFITAYLALSAEDLYRAEDMLSACYYAYAINCGNQFVSFWFEFNLNINNILAALTARKYKMDLSPVSYTHL